MTGVDPLSTENWGHMWHWTGRAWLLPTASSSIVIDHAKVSVM